MMVRTLHVTASSKRCVGKRVTEPINYLVEVLIIAYTVPVPATFREKKTCACFAL